MKNLSTAHSDDVSRRLGSSSEAALEPRPNSIRDTSATDFRVAAAAGWPRNRLILAGIVAAVAVGAILAVRGWMTADVRISSQRIRIAEVTRGDFVRDIAVQGTVVAANSPTIYAPADGAITFSSRAGDRVTKEQILGVLDSPSLVNQHARELSALDSLNSDLERTAIENRRRALKNLEATDQAAVQVHAAEREFKRAESAMGKGVMAERDVAKAHDEVESARLAYTHAAADAKLDTDSMRFELKTKKLERDRQQLLVANLARQVDALTIRSPVDGMIGSLAVNQKTTVSQNTALLTVVDLSGLEVGFKVPESYATDIGLDMNAEIVYGGKVYAGRVTSISPEVKDGEVGGRVRFLDAVPVGMRQNQRVSVKIVIDSRKDALKVQRGAFADLGGTIYVVDGDVAKRRTAKLGAISVGEVELLSGVAAGDRIIISDLSDFADAPEVQLGD